MSEVEKKLEGVLTEYAKMDEGLRDMYVRLREFDSVAKSYNQSKISLDTSAGNLKATRDALILEIDVLRDLTKKLGDNQISIFHEKLDRFEITLEKHQVLFDKNRMKSNGIIWLMIINLLLTFSVFVK